jgi:ABC-type iron transport system FetAB permease component
MNRQADISEKYHIAIAHRLAVMRARLVVSLIIIAFTLYGLFLGKWQLILFVIFAGYIAMWLSSVQATHRVERLTGLSRDEQYSLWNRYRTAAKGARGR